MRSQRPFVVLCAAICWGPLHGGHAVLAQSPEEAPKPPAPPPQTERASKRYTRVIELYDPGIRFSPPPRRDKAAKRAADSFRTQSVEEDPQGYPVIPVQPPSTRLPEDEEKPQSLWLDILYGRDEDETATNNAPSLEGKLRELWGVDSKPLDEPTPAGLFDPYQQMLETYRAMLAEEDRKVSGKMEDRPAEQASDTLSPWPGAEDTDYAPAFSRLLEQAARGMDEEDPATADGPGQDRAGPVVRDSTRDVLDDGTKEDEWDPGRWRNLFRPAPAVASEAAENVATDASDSGLPFSATSETEGQRDFAGLTAIRKQLMLSGTGEGTAASAPAYAPTMVAPAWRASPVEAEAGESFAYRGGEYATGAEPGYGDPAERTAYGSSGRGETEGPARLGGGTTWPPFARFESRDAGSDTSSLGPESSDPIRRRERQVLFDPHRTEDPFAQRDAFGRKKEWGSFGGP